MTEHVCSFRVVIKLAAVMLLASILLAQTSPIWECKSGGGWSMKSDGSMTEIPASEDTVILEFQSPNKMRPVKASSAFEQKIYDEMTWKQVGDKFYGQALIRDGSNIFTVSEVLSETGSVMTMIFRDGDVRTAIGRNVCKKTVSAVAKPSSGNQTAAKSVNQQKKDKSFWCKADELLKVGVDAISERDLVTGARSINVRDQKAAAKRGSQVLDMYLRQARENNVRIFQPGEVPYDLVDSVSKRVIAASHYKNSPYVRYEVLDYDDANAFASGAGNYFVFRGLLEVATEDELAFIIAHEIAHSSAGHVEEAESFISAKDLIGNKPPTNFSTAFTNVAEQEADKIGIVYTALAGYDPCASATYWEKQQNSIYEYAQVRTHPANPRRAATNRKWCSVAKQYWMPGQVNPNAEKILKCNALFCNVSREELQACEGGGVLGVLEVLADSYVKNQEVKKEQKRQEKQVSEARKVIAQQQQEMPPEVNWGQGWNIYKGTVVRHGVKAGLNFAIANGQGQFFYNHNGQAQQGVLQFAGQNQSGYWFSWRDNFGAGQLVLQEYTDGSLRGQMFINDGTNPGKLLGDWIGLR